MRYTEDVFSEVFITTVGIDFKIKEISIDDQPYKIQLWDTAGQEQFHTITKSYFRGAHAILLIYDVTSSISFDRTRMWMDSIKETASSAVDIALVVNKVDLEITEDGVTHDQGVDLAKEFDIPFYEVSAKTGQGINQMFTEIAKVVKKRLDETPPPPPVTKVVLTDQSQSQSSCC